VLPYGGATLTGAEFRSVRRLCGATSDARSSPLPAGVFPSPIADASHTESGDVEANGPAGHYPEHPNYIDDPLSICRSHVDTIFGAANDTSATPRRHRHAGSWLHNLKELRPGSGWRNERYAERLGLVVGEDVMLAADGLCMLDLVETGRSAMSEFADSLRRTSTNIVPLSQASWQLRCHGPLDPRVAITSSVHLSPT
jgi:hypothetical protein